MRGELTGVGRALIATSVAVAAAVPSSPPVEPPVDPVRDGGPLAALCVPDSQLRWLYRPDARGYLRVDGVRVRVRTNELGLRGPSVPAPEADDDCSFRVLVVGGSNTFGWGVPERQRYTELVSARLAHASPRVTLVNAGHWSYDLDQQLALTRELLAKVRPDLVVQAVTPRAFALLRRNGDPTRGALGPVPAAAWAIGRSVLERSRQDVLDSGARYLLVTLPAAPGSGRSWPADLADAVGSAARLADLRAALGPRFYASSGTWTAAGHARIADAIAPHVEAELTALAVLQQRRDLVRVRELVLSLEPRLQTVADRGPIAELAAALRDFVHRRVPLASSPRGSSFLPLFASFRAAVIDPQVGHLCGGLAATYMTALEAFGVPSRYVGMHTGVGAGADSHVSVEYFDGERWIASDPTFDANLADGSSGRLLSWVEVRQRVFAGRPVSISTGRYRVARERRLENYSYPLEVLLRYLVMYSDLDGDGILEAGETITAPAEWDGSVEETDGGRWRHSPFGVWVVLESHPL